MQRFTDRVALVTGAASGIGRATAERLASEGAHVFCCDLNAEALAETVAAIIESGGEAVAHSFDIGSEQQVIDCVKACLVKYGRLDAMVNMAGILRFDITDQLAVTDFQRVIDINLTGTFTLCREVLPHLVESRGSITNAASTAALAGLPCGVAYSASKGAVLAMTRSIAVEYAKRGVRANCICPGDIKTGMADEVSFPEGYDYDLIGRICSLSGARGPEAVAGVIAMLASDDGVHINGEDIRMDGATLS